MAHEIHARGAIDGALLDVDGTLLDSNDAHARAWSDAFGEHGYPVPADRIRPLIGMGGDKLLALIAGIAADGPEGRAIEERRLQIFTSCYLPHLNPTRGARALLERLRSDGVRRVVVSSAKQAELHGLLERAQVADLIEAATTSDDAERSKPDPDVLHAALGRSGFRRDRVVMIGDTPYDVEAAARSHVACIAVRCGGWDDAALGGAVAIYDDPLDLLQRFDRSLLAPGAARSAGHASAKR